MLVIATVGSWPLRTTSLSIFLILSNRKSSVEPFGDALSDLV